MTDESVGLLRGTVIHGAQRGRVLGFPTANIAVGAHVSPVPADGVYFGWVSNSGGSPTEETPLGDHARPALISVGTNPTFGDAGRSVEAHLLDFDGDLYGMEIDIRFEDRLAPQIKFDAVEALIDHMNALRRAVQPRYEAWRDRSI